MRGSPLALVFLAVFALSGCGDDNGSGPTPESPLDFPLAAGNRWTYDVTTVTRGGPYEETLEVLGTDLVEGLTYWMLEETNNHDAQVDTLRLRQDGQVLYVLLPFDPGSRSGGGGGIDAWLGRVFTESMPWRFADFGAAAGTEWTLAEADTTDDFGAGLQTIAVRISARSLGRTTVTVPAGTYSDVYEGQLLVGTWLDDQVLAESTQNVWFVDGVGMVKNRIVDFEDPGVPMTTTTTSDLKSLMLGS